MNQKNKIPLLTKTLYGIGSISSGVKDTAFNIFLLFFYTQVVGVSGTLAGAAIFIALLFDAISDPFVGYWSDRFKSSWGRRHPFVYFSAVPMGIAFYFLFNPPLGSSETTLFIWMLTFAVLVRFFMTFYMVPSTALAAEMTSDYDERTSLSSFRVLMGWLGGLVFATVAYTVYFAPNEEFADGRLAASAYHDFALLGAIMIVIAILICAKGTHYLIPKLNQNFESSAESQGLKQDFANMLQNKPFLILGLMIFVSASSFGFSEVISLYMFTYFWGFTTEQMTALLMAAALGTLIAFVLIPFLSKSFDKRPIAMMAIALLAVTYPSLIVLRLFGLLPENGDPALMTILGINAVITVFAAVTMTILFVSMIADTVDVNEMNTGQRQEAIYTSAYTFSMKATSGIGGLVAGIILDLISFPSDVDVSSVPQATLDSMGMSVAGTIFVFWSLAFFILSKYPLSREDHKEVLAKIKKADGTEQKHVDEEGVLGSV